MKIVWIAVDTLRADRVGCYQPKKESLTPHMDSLAEESILFEKMIAENNVTQSAFVTMMSGRHPYQHGIVNMKPRSIPRKIHPLSLLLRKHGYQTGAIDCNYRITGPENPWFTRGYQTYIDPARDRTTHLTTSADEINEHALPWLEEHYDKENFFLFLHYWDPHYPYRPQSDVPITIEPIRDDHLQLKNVMREPLYSYVKEWNPETNNPDYICAQYDQTVSQVDRAIGEVIATLKRLQIFEDTLLLLVADHGEGMGDHQIYFNHHSLYDSMIHVPFMLCYPRQFPQHKRIPALVEQADITPTILTLANIQPPRHFTPMDGKPLIPLIHERKKEIHPFVISCEANWHLKRSIRTHKWKLIQAFDKDAYGNPRFELYDLVNDPLENSNLAAKHPQIVKTLHRQMTRWVRYMLKKYKREDPLRIGVREHLHPLTANEEEKVKKRLTELGY
ncbi:sulfatase [Mechercharimyces sp. CAU 1602]|uniref:sulfatase n=1 Tax=Mechercharimyces sp. CAU 1602 TaxID=2973933 RepID=UPI002162D0D3|nr:sulfatase [Mechercharimyces sp. CAU 1602]MCS1351116.1 sulfatase-like hydrolase/transferase [Mechercharimyces sp. CAU 1602]